MASVKMLTSISGPAGSASPGDVWECSSEEAKRLIELGMADPMVTARKSTTKKATAPSVETAVAE